MTLQEPGNLRARLLLPALGVLLGMGIALVLNTAVPPSAMRDEMPGGYYTYDPLVEPPATIVGFHTPERDAVGVTYRWTGERALINFPYAANMGRNMDVRLRLAANVVPGQAPAELTLLLNGRPSAQWTVSGPFQVFSATFDTRQLPNPYLEPAHVQVELRSSVVSLPSDPRELGVAVDWIEVAPQRSRLEGAIEAVVWALAIGCVLLATLRLGSLRWSAAYGAATLATLVGVHLTYLPRAIHPTIEAALVGLAWLLAALLAPQRKPLWGIGLAACGLWILVAGRIFGDWQMDDAYISYRYAWNFVHGHGLVYNPGEIVEGYTNFLWTLLAAVAIWLGWSPGAWALAAMLVASQCLLALTFGLAGKLAGPFSPTPLLAVGLLSLDVGFLVYGARGSGIEAVPFALLILLAIALLWTIPGREEGQRTRDKSIHIPVGVSYSLLGGLALALASLTRPEGLLVAALLLAVRGWQGRREGGQWVRMLLAALLPYLVVVLPYQAWRILFYGYPFPNTFYAKVGSTLEAVPRGLDYVGQFVAGHWLLCALLLSGGVLALARWLPTRRGERTTERGNAVAKRGISIAQDGAGNLRAALVLLTAVYTLYVIVVGGDWFPVGRFFVPLLAPFALLAGEAARFLWQWAEARNPNLGTAWGAALLALLMAYGASTLWLQRPGGELATRLDIENFAVDGSGWAGVWLRENTPPQTYVAAGAAGSIAYYSRRPVLDMFGLNDLHIARVPVGAMGEGVAGHEKRDPLYVLDKQPDFITRTWEGYFLPYEARLDLEYEPVELYSPAGPSFELLRRKRDP